MSGPTPETDPFASGRADLKARLVATLLSIHEDAAARRCLETFGFLRFRGVEESDYATLQVPRT